MKALSQKFLDLLKDRKKRQFDRPTLDGGFILGFGAGLLWGDFFSPLWANIAGLLLLVAAKVYYSSLPEKLTPKPDAE